MRPDKSTALLAVKDAMRDTPSKDMDDSNEEVTQECTCPKCGYTSLEEDFHPMEAEAPPSHEPPPADDDAEAY